MKSKTQSLQVKLDELELDVNNPRFAELYSGSTKEEDLIEYLLYTEAAEDVAKAIVNAGEFYPDRPLWVLRNGDKYLVKDGNRRCAAVKALQMPGKYKLPLDKTTINELPVLLYNNQGDLDKRIVEEHASNLFRSWERIAKALEILRLYDSGRSDEARELDSKPSDLIKLASFYKQAVIIGGDDLRKLLRRGRGKSGGKTIVFERLFKYADKCGYRFKNSPSHKIDIIDQAKFSAYISAVVKILIDHPSINTDYIDREHKEFFVRLKQYGFDKDAQPTTTSGASAAGSTSGSSSTTSTSGGADGTGNGGPTNGAGSNSGAGGAPTNGGGTGSSGSSTPGTSGGASSRGSTKKYPITRRKQVPPGLKGLIKEYFDLDPDQETNSKVAMARITFECVLKYVVENTKFNGRTNMSKSGYWAAIFTGRKFTDFTGLKTKFTDLITSTGDKNAFNSFNLDHMHQIVHNYKVSALPKDAKEISNNLISIIEFLLQDEAELLSSLDLTRL